jgi:Domain of unknown function (DUF6362)
MSDLALDASCRAISTTKHRSASVSTARRRAGQSEGLYDAALVKSRLEEAGSTLLALPSTGYSTKLRSSSLEIVRNAVEGYGWTEKQFRPAVPSAAKITRMDEALAWVLLIPVENYVLRRIVGARCLVHPVSERHLFTWRRLATLLGADHKAVQRWHGQAVCMLVTALNRGEGGGAQEGQIGRGRTRL